MDHLTVDSGLGFEGDFSAEWQETTLVILVGQKGPDRVRMVPLLAAGAAVLLCSARDTPFTIPHPSSLPGVAVAAVRFRNGRWFGMPSQRAVQATVWLVCDMDSELTDMADTKAMEEDGGTCGGLAAAGYLTGAGTSQRHTHMEPTLECSCVPFSREAQGELGGAQEAGTHGVAALAAVLVAEEGTGACSTGGGGGGGGYSGGGGGGSSPVYLSGGGGASLNLGRLSDQSNQDGVNSKGDGSVQY